MLTLPAFKTNVLEPLLRGDSIPTERAANTPITLFAATLDRPLDYVFESDEWIEIVGASTRLARAGEKLLAVLAADGYMANDLLHHSATGVLALCHDPALADRWAEAVQQAVAAETEIVTVSTVVRGFTVQQLLTGLYRAPRSVIGVPGFNDYQARINRYYGLDSPSTVPKEEAVTARRHFGEVVALGHLLLAGARESRQLHPFYERLPFALRCESCHNRPAERLENDIPICGVCLRKRQVARLDRLDRAALVHLEAVGLAQVLEQQRSPSAYRRLCHDFEATLHEAINSFKRDALVLAGGLGWSLLALPPETALETSASVLERITLHYGLKLSLPTVAAVVLAEAPGQTFDQWRALNTFAAEMIANLRRAADGITGLIDVRPFRPNQPFDRFRKPYTLDEARQLIAGVAILREAKLPAGLFPELADHAARGSAGLYYTFEKSKLSQGQQQPFQRLERSWEAGSTPGLRFFSMLATALLLAQKPPR